MSGGVDSSVAAHLLHRQGHEVIGVFMRHGEQSPVACASDTACDGAGGSSLLPIVEPRTDHRQGCCTAADADDARRVADLLDIPFYAINLEQEFGQIIDYFVDEYTAARTPNPCIVCNNLLKFGKLVDYADSVGAQYIATGHYARLEQRPDETAPALLRGRDSSKDQSYVLFGVERSVLDRMMLPIGDYEKTEIRRMAVEFGLRVADKRDSQEICFVTSGRYDEFVRRRTSLDTAGELVTTDGTVVGTHAGIEGFTIGQRKGIGVALGEPRFVVRIEADSRRVVIGTHDELARDELTARETNWLAREPTGPFRCLAQIRYNSPAVPATARPLPDGRLHVALDEPAHGVAPGQAVVCYHEDRVLGGGWIE